MSKVEQYITSIPDFPKEGIIFRDITTVLGDADGFRGFLFGAPMAYNLHKAFIPIRKQGKLPRATSRMSYELEYGMETIEVHRDDIKPGMKIVVVDDLIATGGTLEAAVHLLEQLGAKVVKVVCLLELKGLHGRDRIKTCPAETVVAYEGK